MANYTFGNRVRIKANFTDDDGPADPDTLSIKIRRFGQPATEVRYAYGTDPEIVKAGIGSYHVIFDPPSVGRWRYYWLGSGDAKGATEGEFRVVLNYG